MAIIGTLNLPETQIVTLEAPVYQETHVVVQLSDERIDSALEMDRRIREILESRDVEERIYLLRSEFIMKHGKIPNAIYANSADHYALLRSKPPYLANQGNLFEIMGMQVIPVLNIETHLGFSMFN